MPRTKQDTPLLTFGVSEGVVVAVVAKKVKNPSTHVCSRERGGHWWWLSPRKKKIKVVP
jgi:hypothetical protein